MKKLFSKFHETGWEANSVTYPVECLPLAEIWRSAPIANELYGKPFYKNIKNDIEKDGLHFPLICVLATYEQMIEKKKRHHKHLNDLPFDPDNCDLTKKQYVVWGGSNRHAAAEELGYTHIDCAIIPSFEKAHTLQAHMRQPYKSRYYSRR